MGVLNDELIDTKAKLCWNHQQEQLLGKIEIDCICGQLLDMIVATREEIAKEIARELCDSEDGECWGVNGEHCDNVNKCIAIARGTK